MTETKLTDKQIARRRNTAQLLGVFVVARAISEAIDRGLIDQGDVQAAQDILTPLGWEALTFAVGALVYRGITIAARELHPFGAWLEGFPTIPTYPVLTRLDSTPEETDPDD